MILENEGEEFRISDVGFEMSGDGLQVLKSELARWRRDDRGVKLMKMQEIRLLAKKMGINSFGKTKTELIREIQRKEGHFDCYGTATDYCDQSECLFLSSCLGEPTKK